MLKKRDMIGFCIGASLGVIAYSLMTDKYTIIEYSPSCYIHMDE